MNYILDISSDQKVTSNTTLNKVTISTTLILSSIVVLLIKLSIKLFEKRKSSKATLPSNNVVMNAHYIPTLPSIPIIGPLYPLLWKDFGTLFTSWTTNYGTTFRSKLLGRNFVFLSDPNKLQKLLASSEPGHLLKYPALYHNVFPSVMKTGLIATSNIPDWKHNRLILSKAFSLESLKAYITVFNRHSKKLVTDLHTELNNKSLKAVNGTKTLHGMLRESTFNTTAEIIIGSNTLSAVDKLRVHDKFARCQDIISYRHYHPWCLIDLVWKFHPQKKEMDELINSLIEIFDKVIKDGRGKSDEEKSVKSFIDFMDIAGLDNIQIFAEASNSFSAGYDTVHNALNFFLFNMALHPKYQDECRKEIDDVFYSLSGSCDEVDGDVTFNTLSDMKYLEMCIKESLRMFPPVPGFLRELGSPLNLDENIMLGKGTLVFVSPLLIHRDPQIYHDPLKYDPDRFLPENCKSRSVYSFLPFSYGNRNCIGWKLAMIEIKVLASYVLRHYEVYTENSYDNVNKVWNTSIWPTKDLGVRWRKRRQISLE